MNDAKKRMDELKRLIAEGAARVSPEDLQNPEVMEEAGLDLKLEELRRYAEEEVLPHLTEEERKTFSLAALVAGNVRLPGE